MSFNLAFAIARKRTEFLSDRSKQSLTCLLRPGGWFFPIALIAASLLVAPAAYAAVPVASNVSISGTAQEGQTLNGSYTYSDSDGDLENLGATVQRWLRGGTVPVGTGSSYVVQAGDVGSTLVFEVTPHALTETAPNELIGAAAQSNPTASVVAANTAPYATGVSISGTAEAGQTLTGNYTYNDDDGDSQSGTTFRWLRGGGATVGTASNYTVQAGDVGSTLRFEVTPRASAGVINGSPVLSAPTATVVAANTAPYATGVSISGTAEAGQTLTGNYTYNDDDGDSQSGTTFRWLRGGATVGTASNYTVQAGDVGSTLRFEVTPRASAGVTNGSPVQSNPTATVVAANVAPVANNVSISGTAEVGQTLTGTYNYFDADGDSQNVGATTRRWLRNGSVQVGTGGSYLIQPADEGNTLVFEVRPVAQTGVTNGVATTSSPTGPVGAANVAPVANNVSISGTAEVGQTLTGTYNYFDADGDSQNVGATTRRWLRNGSVQVGTGGSYLIQPADEGNTLVFEVRPVAQTGVTNGVATASSPTGPVGAANVAPVANNVSISGTAEEGQTLTGNYNYFDADGDPESGTTFRWLRNGSTPVGGASTYTIQAGDVGATLVFEVTPRSSAGVTNGSPVRSAPTGVIGASNVAPVANPQSVSTNEDTDRPITLTATDGDGDTLTFSIVSGPNNGTILGTAPTVTYRPNANYNGPDSFTFKANDGTVDSNTATISITVNPQNDPPTSTPIGNQSASEGLPFSLNVSGNFDDVDGDDLTYSATGLPASLTPINSGSGLISGTPTLAEAQANGGIYNVTVTATDPLNSSVATSFVLTIGIVNDAPVANAQNLATDEDNSLPIVLTGFDADGDTLTYTVIGSPTNGALVGEPPNLTYTPNLNFNGADSFSFTVNDGTVSSAPALISITVNPVNDLPVLVLPIDDQQAVEAAPFSLDVSGNFDDVDGGGLTFSAIGLPASLGPIDPVTGVIDGTPTQAEAQANDGIYIVTVTATDGAAESVTDTFQLLVVELGRANVALSVSAAPTPAMLNDQIQFSFVVSNNGPAPATDIELNGSFIGNGLVVAPSGATTCTLEAAVNQVTNFNCLIGMLNLSASTSLTISVSTANPGAVTLAATAAVSTPLPIDPDLQDNSAQTTVGVAEFFSNGAVQILGNSQILSVAHGDVNGDGATDIVLGTVAGIPAQVYLSSGFRDFSVAAISVPDSSAQQGVALADFDNNGTLDMVLANAGVPDAVYGNDGSGNFTLMATLPGDTFSNDVAAGLLNNDNNMDIVVARTGGNMVYLGDGSGGFAASGAPLGIADSRAVAVGRVNNNARPDVVFANVGSPSALWNDVGFSANNAPSDTFDIGDASSVVIAELLGGTNADALDIAFGRIPTFVGDIPENVLIINNGSGGAAGMIRIGAAPTNDILAGDVNRDGLNDLVFVNATGVHQIWTRSGDSFALHPEQIVADDAVSGVIADLGDTDVDEPGGVDLAMGGFPTTGAGVYLNDGTGNLGKGDITPPVLELNGANPMEIASGSPFVDPRARATDNINGDISASVIATGTVNTAVVGSYTVTYNVSDLAGNPAVPITRTVTIIPGTGTGGGGGGSISPFAIGFLLTLLMVSYAMRRVYIAQVTNNKNQ